MDSVIVRVTSDTVCPCSVVSIQDIVVSAYKVGRADNFQLIKQLVVLWTLVWTLLIRWEVLGAGPLIYSVILSSLLQQSVYLCFCKCVIQHYASAQTNVAPAGSSGGPGEGVREEKKPKHCTHCGPTAASALHPVLSCPACLLIGAIQKAGEALHGAQQFEESLLRLLLSSCCCLCSPPCCTLPAC